MYDAIVNDKVVKTNGIPKFTFETQELYQQADHLSQQIPHWKSDNENPIHQYIPLNKRPFKTSTDFNGSGEISMRESKLMSLSQNRFNQRNLMLAGTMQLNKRTVSPQTKIKERNGFLAGQRMPDCFQAKKEHANEKLFGFDLRSKTKEKLPQEYNDPKPHQYRDLKEIIPGTKDFELRFKVDPIDNPKGLSVFADKPKFIVDKEKELLEREERDRKWRLARKP